MNDIARMDATAQADLVRNKQVKPIELVEGAIERIERLNPKLNAVITPMYDEARRVASGPLPDGPFTGVPFLLKDLGASYAGVRQAQGSAFLQDFISPMDTELTTRFKRAGLVILGKTNTPEFGLVPTTEPRLFGLTRNPWNTERITGGSSGGSAAAVASGMVPFAHANDGGGSIRIPASCCGLVGLKPTRARVSAAPMGDMLAGLAIELAVTRSVRDCAALLDAVAGYVPGDPYVAPAPERPFLQEVGRDAGRLRIAFTTKTLFGEPVHADCDAAVRDVAGLLSQLGHEVEEDAPAINMGQLTQSFIAVWAAGAAWGIDALAMMTGRKPEPQYFETLTWGLYEQGRQISASDFMMALMALQLAARSGAGFHERYDVWLTPTLAEPPLPLGNLESPPEAPLRGFERAAAFVPYTPIQNTTGQPAISLPLYWNADGLPIGVHFVGRFGDEATLFRLASQLEQARPWAERWPAVSA